MTLTTLLAFALASAAILAIPGPAVVFIVTRSIEHGRRAGIVSMLGVQAGGLVHILAAAAGVSAILASSTAAFNVVKYAGAAYLVVLGIQRIRHAGAPLPAPDLAVEHHRRLFRQGFVVNVLNPKVTVFFLAFLPQFVDRDHAAAPQMLLLGGIYATIAICSDGAYAMLAGTIGDRLRADVRMRTRMERGSGVVYLGLGAIAALAGERR